MKYGKYAVFILCLLALKSQGTIYRQIVEFDGKDLSSIPTEDIGFLYEATRQTDSEDLEYQILVLWRGILKAKLVKALQKKDDDAVRKIQESLGDIASKFKDLGADDAAFKTNDIAKKSLDDLLGAAGTQESS